MAKNPPTSFSVVLVSLTLLTNLFVPIHQHPLESVNPEQQTSPDYSTVLRLSLLFYEAQRSGKLPKSNKVPWRHDSALEDKGLTGEDLTGGYYDAGDFVKFSFTMAFTTTLLAWGLISYEQAYKKADQYGEALDAIKWAGDYFIKCHVSPAEFYGQVGDFVIDHRFWGRPEDLNMTRPAYKIDSKHPGSDLAGEASAALSAVSVAFRKIDEKYSRLALEHSIQLYEFAVKYRGFYHDTIPGAKTYYQSFSYGDELAWAAIWLYKASGNEKYLRDAETFYETFSLKDDETQQFFYNNKSAGVKVLLAQETRKSEYILALETFCDHALKIQKRTSKGLVYYRKMGTLSLAANSALICLQAADLGISRQDYVQFAKQQIGYMLGSSTGKSFVVGYGTDYPKKPHHAASSCPKLPDACGWDQYKSKEPNPQILYGALVSGPDQNDLYEDRRDEYLYNEVTLDYNAGFQGAVAGLLQIDRK